MNFDDTLHLLGETRDFWSFAPHLEMITFLELSILTPVGFREDVFMF
jgi:hypothetical protein